MEYKAGLNQIIVKKPSVKREEFALPTEQKPQKLEVVSIGWASPDVNDPNLGECTYVMVAPNSNFVKIDEEHIAYRQTSIVAYI